MPHAPGRGLAAGQILSLGSLTSDNDIFTLEHQGDGNLVVYHAPHDNARREAIWATGTHGTSPGRTILQDDGNLVVYDAGGSARWATGTDGTPANRLTVRDDGDLVLTDDAGRVHWRSGTTMHWIAYLDIGDAHCVSFVRGVDEREALIRLGAAPESVRPMTFERAYELTYAENPDAMGSCAVAVRFGDWILLVEQNGAEGIYRAGELSAGGAEVVAAYVSVNYDQQFVWARDGVTLIDYDEGAPEYASGTDPAVIEPYLDQVGRHRFDDDAPEPTEEEKERPDLALALAVTGIAPQPADFAGELLGATWITPRNAEFRQAISARQAAQG